MKPHRLPYVIMLGLLCCSASIAFAQTGEPSNETDSDADSSQMSTEATYGSYVLESVEYHIVGRTRKVHLQDLLDLEVGRSFETREELDSFMSRQEQLLVNQRVLQRARIEYRVRGSGEGGVSSDGATLGGPGRVEVDVYTEDTWNLLALPYFKYDSNTGLLLSLRGRDYNFLGTMEEFRFNVDYRLTEKQENEWAFLTDFTLPFQWLGRDWSWALEQQLLIEPNKQVEWEIETSLSYDFSLLLDWTVAFSQGYDLDTQPDDEEADNGGRSYFTTGLSLGTEIGTGLIIPEAGELSYDPELYTEARYPRGEDAPRDSGVFREYAIGFDHQIGAEQVDWVGNFRRGWGFSLVNENEYGVLAGSWDRSIEATVRGYEPLGPVAFSGRLTGFLRFDQLNEDAGGPIRGILDKRIDADYGAFANADFTVSVFTIPKFMEGQGSLFYDLGLVGRHDSSLSTGERLRQGIGIEAIGFPLFARSLFVRVSFGTDLDELAEEGTSAIWPNREIFIGLGHHY